MYVGAARKVFPNKLVAERIKNHYLRLFPIFSRYGIEPIGFQGSFFQVSKLLAYVALENDASWASGVYCFEPMLFRHSNLYFSTIISMRKQRRFVSKQGQPRPRTQLKARVLTKQLKNALLEATLLGPLLPPRNSSSCYFDTVKYVSPSQIWAIPLYSSSCFILYRFKTSKKKQQIICLLWFPYCSGYHVRFTRGRSPVQIWPEILYLFFL